MANTKKQKPPVGSSLDDFLLSLPDEEQVAIKAGAIKLQLALRARKEMKKQGITVRKLEKMMGTSPSQIQRILDGEHTGVSLKNIVKLYSVLGKDLKVTVK